MERARFGDSESSSPSPSVPTAAPMTFSLAAGARSRPFFLFLSREGNETFVSSQQTGQKREKNPESIRIRVSKIRDDFPHSLIFRQRKSSWLVDWRKRVSFSPRIQITDLQRCRARDGGGRAQVHGGRVFVARARGEGRAGGEREKEEDSEVQWHGGASIFFFPPGTRLLRRAALTFFGKAKGYETSVFTCSSFP